MRWRTWAGTLAGVVVCGLAAVPGAGADEMSDYASVRRDWQPDRVITACRFTVEQLENARGLMTGEDNYSGFQGAIEAEIARQRTGGCPGGGGVAGVPVVSRVRFTPAAVRAGRATTLRFALSRGAAVRIAIERRRGARWAVLRRLVRGGRRAGNQAVAFSTRGLAPGRYRVSLIAVADGERSRAKTAPLRVLRR